MSRATRTLRDLMNFQMVSCFYRRQLVPDIIVELTEAAKAFCTTEGEECINHLAELSIRLNQLHARIAHATIMPEKALQMLIQLDDDLESCAKSVPPILLATRVSKNRQDVGYPYIDFYNGYQQSWIAEMWNSYSAIRLLLTRHVMGDCIPGPLKLDTWVKHLSAESDPVTAQALRMRFEETEMEQRHRVCANVPYLLNDSKDGDAPPRPNLTAYSLSTNFWVLYDAATGLRTPQPMRDWIISILRSIEKETGMRLAGAIAEDLERPYHADMQDPRWGNALYRKLKTLGRVA